MLKNYRISLAHIIALFCLGAYPCAAQNSYNFPRLTAGEYINGLPKQAGMSAEDLLRTALAFSGFTDETSAEFAAAYSTLCAAAFEAADADSALVSARSRAEGVLTRLHDRFFTKYEESQSSMETLAREGTYNCVSAAVMYTAAARAAGLNVFAKITGEHAFCAVVIDGKAIDVETTSKYGFDPGRKKTLYDSAGNPIAESYVAPVKTQDARSAQDGELASLILANRSALFCNRGDYARGIPAALDRAVYLSEFSGADSSEAFAVLYETCGNYTTELQRAGRFGESLAWAKLVTDELGAAAVSRDKLDKAVYNAVADALNSKNFAAAAGYYEQWKAELTDSREERVFSMLCLAAFAQYAAEETPDDAIALLAAADSSSYPLDSIRGSGESADFIRTYIVGANRRPEFAAREKTSVRDMLVSQWARKAEGAAAEYDFLKAEEIITAAIESVGADKRLINARTVYHNNYCRSAHNEFVKLYNGGFYELALKKIEDAMKNAPESDLLRSDREAAARRLNSN